MRSRFWSTRVWMPLLSAVTVSLGCASEPAVSADTLTPLRLSTGARGGSFHAMGEALVRTRQAEGLSSAIENQETAGAVSNLEALQDGRTDCAFSYADVAYEALAGRLPDESKPFDRLRGVALVQLSPLYFLVLRDSPIRGVTDLRGRRVALRTPESGSLQAAMLVLEAYGVETMSLNIQSESFPGTFARLRDGSVDALFLLTGQPSSSIARAVAGNARILSLVGAPIDRLRDEYPFLRPSLILGGIYPGHEQPTRTIGVESLLLCRVDLELKQVYDLTKTWFLTANELSSVDLMSSPIGPGSAAATPIPLHAGAARYYRERQLLP